MTERDGSSRPGAPVSDFAAGSREAELRALLLRSATLDRSPSEVRQRSIQAAVASLGRQGSRRRLGRASIPAFAIAAGLAALWLTARPSSPVPVSAEALPETLTPPKANVIGGQKASTQCANTQVARGDELELDDLEDGDASLLLRDGRTGVWMAYHDGTGQTRPPTASVLLPSRIPEGRGKSRYALNLTGGRFWNWGVSVGSELSTQPCYDLGAYAGVEFWARGASRMHVGIQMIDDIETSSGGTCVEHCYNEHRKRIELTPQWTRYQVRWKEVERLQPEPAIPFDPRRAKRVTFVVLAVDTPFELWLDDIALIRRD